MYPSASRSYICTSDPQMPQARTLINTSSAWIFGSATSTIENRGCRQARLPLGATCRALVGVKPSRGAHSPSSNIALITPLLKPPRSDDGTRQYARVRVERRARSPEPRPRRGWLRADRPPDDSWLLATRSAPPSPGVGLGDDAGSPRYVSYRTA